MSSPFTPPEADLEVAPPSVLELLWLNHRGALMAGVAGIILLGMIILGVTVSRRTGEIASQNALAAANDPSGWNALIANYPGTPATADAMLLLAASLRDSGKIDESDALYSRFAESFPRNPLVVSGLLGRASNARVAGRLSDAFNDYQQAAAAYPQSYGAPVALFSQFRLLAQEGKTEEAKRILQTIASQYPLSVAAQVAGIRPQLSRQQAD